ncbi:hypothetical protein [Nocardiopsis suaedae]|uniref:DUF3558 domain-containing protein n=1 Tax=Nocardiopsis suaedae TaxID=3018444 RepID=A0ABT4TEM1_9ACTN|nr:hypothetical protein [Nocardiopsis suaedae]MDA2803152.1 hypothetical protein [Nocardiopsis suaedae]
MGRRAVPLAVPLALVLVALLAGCTGQVHLRPGPARPAASSEDGFVLHKGDGLHAVNDINLVLPEGWRALGSDGCLAPPAAVKKAGRVQGRQDEPVPCPPAAMRLRFNVSERGGIGRGDLDSDTGWKRPNVVCPGSVGQVGSAVPGLVKRENREDFDLVSGETVEQTAWRLKCEGGKPFESRLWLVPDADVALDVAIVDPAADYDRIAHSMDLSRYTP